MNISDTLTVKRTTGDARDIATYLYGSANVNDIEILTGYTLACEFTAEGQSDVNTAAVLYAGDGRAHIPVTTAIIDTPRTWKLKITGTDGGGKAIAPILGTIEVSDP